MNICWTVSCYYSCWWGWQRDYVSERRQWGYCSSPRWRMTMEPHCNDTHMEKPKNLGGGGPVPVQLCPSQISHGLTRAQTRAFSVRCQWLTAWAIAKGSVRSLGIIKHLLFFSLAVSLSSLYYTPLFSVCDKEEAQFQTWQLCCLRVSSQLISGIACLCMRVSERAPPHTVTEENPL
jgi:hypothetical protein